MKKSPPTPAKPWIEPCDGGVLLRLRVQPKASRNAFVRESDGRIRVALTAPAADGAANRGLAQFVSKALGVSTSAVEITHGKKSRSKTVKIEGVSLAAVRDFFFSL